MLWLRFINDHGVAKLQFMVWGSRAPGLRDSSEDPDDELVMDSKREIACFEEGEKFIFHISVFDFKMSVMV